MQENRVILFTSNTNDANDGNDAFFAMRHSSFSDILIFFYISHRKKTDILLFSCHSCHLCHFCSHPISLSFTSYPPYAKLYVIALHFFFPCVGLFVFYIATNIVKFYQHIEYTEKNVRFCTMQRINTL